MAIRKIIRRRTWSFHVVVLHRAAKKCTKIYNARAQLLFCSLNLLFGDVLVAVVVVVCLSSLKTIQSPIPSVQKTVPPPAPPPTTPPPPPGLMIIPWGGHTIYNGSALQLINTSAIDNCLMILYTLTTESAKIGSYLENNNEIVCQILCRTLELICGGGIPEAKVEWMKTGCPVQVGTNGILDFWGNEETMLKQYLIPLMRSNVTSSCSSTSFPQLGVSVRWANTAALRYL